MNHLEQLISEWLENKDYFVRQNVKVGRLSHGGWEGELDVVAYHPRKRHLLHIEPSLDSIPWGKREEKFRKKFKAGREYIKDIFPQVKTNVKIEQWAVLWASDANHKSIGGGKVKTLEKLYKTITEDIPEINRRGSRALISENYPLLRTMQFTIWAVRNDRTNRRP